MSLRRRTRVLSTLAPATSAAELPALIAKLVEDDREEVLDLLAPSGLPAPAGWEPVALLGRGGMGEAWLCGRGDGELAVLKILRPDLIGHGQAEARFRREIAATLAVRHRNVVATLAADAEAGRMLLEFVAGGDLRAITKVAGPLSEDDALAVAMQIADGLAAFEVCGLVHRDLKPANLFVTPEGVVRIADLGLAVSIAADRTRLTAAGRAVGSWAYMSPEQLDGSETIDHRSDHFSLGVCIVALIAGRTPGDQDHRPLTIDRAEALIRPGPRLRQVLARLLHPQPGGRPADAAALRDVLAGAVTGPTGGVPSLALRSTAARLDDAGSDVDASTTIHRADTLLLPATVTDAPPLTTDRILIGSSRSATRWMVWAGNRMVLGKMRGNGVDLPLRNYPIEAHRDALEELSRRHAEISLIDGVARVRDLGSANGSRLDGARLGPDAVVLRPLEEAVLDLSGQVLVGVTARPGGVVIRRLRNSRSIGYALLQGGLSCGPADADLPWPEAAQTVRLHHGADGWMISDRPCREGPVQDLPCAWVRPLDLSDFDIPEPT